LKKEKGYCASEVMKEQDCWPKCSQLRRDADSKHRLVRSAGCGQKECFEGERKKRICQMVLSEGRDYAGAR